jgi:hypothetical protein
VTLNRLIELTFKLANEPSYFEDEWFISPVACAFRFGMSDRIKPFSTDELSARLFSLDIAATVEPLVPEAEVIRQELIDESKERGQFDESASRLRLNIRSSPDRRRLLRVKRKESAIISRLRSAMRYVRSEGWSEAFQDNDSHVKNDDGHYSSGLVPELQTSRALLWT